MTRKSGFSVHPDTTGGEFRRRAESAYTVKPGDTVEIRFRIAGHSKGDLIGYGAWFWHSDGIWGTVVGGPDKRTLTEYVGGSWNKVGSIWQATSNEPIRVEFTLASSKTGTIAISAPVCGRIRHRHLDGARPELLSNMYQFAPESVFADGAVDAEVDVVVPNGVTQYQRELLLKSCNRCGRYLPINFPNERDQLSFSNHCVAAHRRPCKHATFSRLRNIDAPGDVLQLDFGFQLECRFCKKFEVNAAHNPQRTSAQMKEDGARRRAFELLLAELYAGTPQLRYRHQHGTELADDVWRRFNAECFKCGKALRSPRHMHLDHTRPLALLWPLDGTATALCGPCNSEKRDRAPGDFYTDEKLDGLARITGIPVAELRSAQPNEEALDLLVARIDWFFADFLTREEMVKERDGKIAGELVVKALQKVFARSARHHAFDLCGEYQKRRS